MNRRNFLKFIGKGVGIGVVAATIGLPEIPEELEFSVPSYKEKPQEKFRELTDALVETINSFDYLAVSAQKASEAIQMRCCYLE